MNAFALDTVEKGEQYPSCPKTVRQNNENSCPIFVFMICKENKIQP